MKKQAKAIKAREPWHALGADEAFEKLGSRQTGLAEPEAEERLKEYGPNRLTPPKRRGPLERLASQFHNVLIYVLMAAGGVTALLGHWMDAWVIAGVVLINATVGFLQEGKAERALEAIKNMLSLEASVRRGEKKSVIPADMIVPGDVVSLQSGDKVPADMRLFTARDLRIDEAMLTGESIPAEKASAAVDEAAAIGDRSSMAFSGTLVAYGQGEGVVVATADDTEIGLINMMLASVRPLKTKLLRELEEMSRLLTVAILGIAAATFLFGMFVSELAFSEMFMVAVGLVVAAIPEGLPAIITITLAMGVQRMARRNAIIRRLPAVETLGSVTAICSDKTGTLTKNEMTVKSVITAQGLYEAGGTGYDPHGGFSAQGRNIEPSEHPGLMELALAGFLCNDSSVAEQDGRWKAQGDPTEAALVTLAMKAGLDPAREAANFPRLDAIPFESEHRFMATLNHDHAGHSFIYLKGAPELIIEMSSRQRMSGEDRTMDVAYWHRMMEEVASRGERVIAVATRPADEGQRGLEFSDVGGGFTMLGLCGLIDPPRAEAIEAVKSCRAAGIGVKMITGDHLSTAKAIGDMMGIGGEGREAVSGSQIEEMSDDLLGLSVRKTDIYARVSPEHKLRLVRALQANGEVVAMTGDGVNDAPALKQADVGIAMGIKGTEVTKEAAEVVLADDNFVSIANAVEEGRTVYDNIRKAITFILPTNGGEAGIIIAAILSGRMLPITPVQILWINMVTAVTLALSLSFEPPEKGIMQRPPRSPSEPILNVFLLWRITFVSLVLVMGTFGLFLWERFHGASIEAARAIAVNTLVMFEVFYLLNTRYLRTSAFSMQGLFGNRAVLFCIALVVALQIIFTHTAPMQRAFGIAPITLLDWLRIVMVTASVFLLVEAEKFLLRNKLHWRQSNH